MTPHKENTQQGQKVSSLSCLRSPYKMTKIDSIYFSKSVGILQMPRKLKAHKFKGSLHGS